MQKIFGQYNLMTELAQKYSHSTYQASVIDSQKEHDEPERQVALTTFASSLCRLPHERESLLKRAQCIKDLQHAHLAPILDMGIEQEQLFVVREYWPNGSLRSRLKHLSPGRLELGEALTIVLQVGQALVYAHEHGIIHGNIKPENVLLDGNGQAVLADCSLIGRKDVIIRDQASEEYAFCYMAPEQFAGITDARSDQYSLGCLAYELITGRVPFAVQSLASMMGYQSDRVPDPLSQNVADLPSPLEVAVLKTLAKDPDERFFDFSLFLEVIQSILSPPPAFPLLSSTYSGKKRTTSHSAQLAKAEIISSPIRKRAAKHAAPRLSEPSRVPWSAEAETISSSIHKSATKREASQLSEPSETLWSAEAKKAIELIVATPITEKSPDIRPYSGSREASLGINPEEEGSDLDTKPTGIESNVWFIEPSVEEEEGRLLAEAAASSADEQSEDTTDKMASSLKRNADRRGPMTVLAQLSRRRVVKSGLLLSVIVAIVCCALWFSGIVSFGTSSSLSNSTSNNSGANLRINPTAIVQQVSKIPSVIIPTVIPAASFSQNTTLASFKPSAGNGSSSSSAANNSNTSNPTSGSSSSSAANNSNMLNPINGGFGQGGRGGGGGGGRW